MASSNCPIINALTALLHEPQRRFHFEPHAARWEVPLRLQCTQLTHARLANLSHLWRTAINRHTWCHGRQNQGFIAKDVAICALARSLSITASIPRRVPCFGCWPSNVHCLTWTPGIVVARERRVDTAASISFHRRAEDVGNRFQSNPFFCVGPAHRSYRRNRLLSRLCFPGPAAF